MSLSRIRHIGLKSLILLLFSTLSFNSVAEWSGTLRSGYSYTDNLGSQLTVDQGLGASEVVARDGWATQGNLVVQSVNVSGGQALEVFGLYDYGITKLIPDTTNTNPNTNDDSNDISNLNVTASLFRALSDKWLWRLAGDYEFYRYDAVLASGYDGYGANLTLGYFGDNRQGLDLSLAWKFEDHNQLAEPTNQYGVNRVSLNMLYYLPHAKDAALWSLQGRARQNIIDSNKPDFRDYQSFLVGLGVGNWQMGKIQGFAGLQWRSNYYAQTNTSNPPDNNNAQTRRAPNHQGNPPGSGNPPVAGTGGGQMGGQGGVMGPGGNSGVPIISNTVTNDQLLSAGITLSYPFSRYWSARLSADASRYSANTGRVENLYSVFAGLQWGF